MPTSALCLPSSLRKSTSAEEYCQLPAEVVSPFGSSRFIPAMFSGRNSISSRKATGGTGFLLLVKLFGRLLHLLRGGGELGQRVVGVGLGVPAAGGEHGGEDGGECEGDGRPAGHETSEIGGCVWCLAGQARRSGPDPHRASADWLYWPPTTAAPRYSTEDTHMDDSLYFTEHHHQVREMVREFARNHVAPVARELDRTSEFPWENIKAMGELGLLGVPWSEELGGAGMDQLSYYITIHELAKVDASHALTISAHTNLGTSPIVEFGTEEQKRRYVPLLASGKVLGGFGLTEPGAGSDAGGTATTAVDKGDHYVLNGSKVFITHAGVGEIFSVTARTEPGRGNRGITSFIVTKDTRGPGRAASASASAMRPTCPKIKGVRAGKKEDKMGWRASDTRELIFEDAIVPKENLLGKPGQGFVNFLKTLDAGRIGIAALSLGIAEGAYEEALRYAGVRKQFGRFIGSFQAVSFQLADMAMEIEAGTHLLYHAAWLKQHGKPFKKEAAMAKLYLLRAGHAGDHQGGPDLRRLRLYHRISGRADDAGRQGLRDRRGHQRDPADRHRAPDPGRSGGLTGPIPNTPLSRVSYCPTTTRLGAPWVRRLQTWPR